jgi:hypothetical protein
VNYEAGPLWPLIEKGIGDLVENHGLAGQAGQDYIVGYLCKVIPEGQKEAGKLSRRSED